MAMPKSVRDRMTRNPRRMKKRVREGVGTEDGWMDGLSSFRMGGNDRVRKCIILYTCIYTHLDWVLCSHLQTHINWAIFW